MCPGAPDAFANIHTMAQMSVTFKNNCADVAAEIKARANGDVAMNGEAWVDPHNRGTYWVVSSTDSMITTERRTGNRLFVDKQTFALTTTAEGGCNAQMCSESQGTSANSGGTDLCDMWDLYCNSDAVNPDNGVHCEPVKFNLKYTINSEECGRYVFENEYAAHQCQNAETTCLKNPSFMNEEHVKAVANLEQPPKLEIPYKLLQYSTCPGAPDAFANIHTMAQMSVTFKNNCADVAAEIKARANGDVAMNGEAWVDPHTRGTYWVVSS